MVLNLQDFNTSALSLKDFEGQPPLGKTPNERTARVAAASETLAKGQGTDEYQRLKARLLDPASQGQFMLEHQKLRDGIWDGFINSALPDVLADPSMPVEQKDQFVNAALIPQDGRRFLSSMSTLAYTAAAQDDGEYVTAAAENARFNMIDSIERVTTMKRRNQAMINSLKLSDQSTAGMLVDVAELVVPFAEWNHYDRMIGDVTGEGAVERVNALGQQKARLFEQMEAIPMWQRQAFSEKILDIVSQNSQIVLPDGNDLATLETLNRMLINNDYSDTARWVDNVTSVLDIIGLGAGTRAALRGTMTPIQSSRASRTVGGLDGEIIPPSGPARGTVNPNQLDEGMVIDGEFEDISSTIVTQERRPFLLETEEVAQARAQAIHTDVAPASPSQVLKDVNPTAARKAHADMVADETGEVAEALYGTNKTEAVAKDILPEPQTKPGVSPNKVEMYPEPENIRLQRTRDGQSYLTDAEYGNIERNLRETLKSIRGLRLQPSSLVIRTADNGAFGVTARYSPMDSGFTSWADALEAAKVAFRTQRVPPEAFVPMVRNGDEWIETTAKELEAKAALREAGARGSEFEDIDYAVGVKFDYNFAPEDLSIEEVLTTAPGIVTRYAQQVDRLPTQFSASMGQGSVLQNVFDPASIIHPRIVNAAHVAVDRAVGLKKLYQDEFNKFIEPYKKLKGDRKVLMMDYIEQANLEGIALNTQDLYNRGFTQGEVEMLKQWRRANDAVWYATNDDAVKTFRAKGGQIYEHAESDTKLLGYPMARNNQKSSSYVLDVAGNRGVHRMDPDELDELYEKGGTLLRLVEPIEVDGRMVDVVKSVNAPGRGYNRVPYDGEVMMPYREGYYPVMYEANYFVEKVGRMADGAEYRKVMAAARDTDEANLAIKQLKADNPDDVFEARPDRRFDADATDDNIFDSGQWSHITNRSMSAQKVRGQRLGDAGADLNNKLSTHLKDPLEAVAKQVHMVSQRVSMRTYMETMKNRWMQSYGDKLDLPINPKTGQREFPTNVKQIKGSSHEAGLARTNYNYLSSLENGYINGLDAAYKSVLFYTADFLGNAGFTRTQRGVLAASTAAPNRIIKSAAFNVTISANPARQAIIQRTQLALLPFLNPQYALKLVPDLWGINRARMGKGSKHYQELYKEIEASGVLEAVDAHNFLREEQFRLADFSRAKAQGDGGGMFQHGGRAVLNAVKSPLRIAQKYGFDLAEQDILLGFWLSERDKAIRAGKSMKSQRVQDEVLGKARALAGGMNRAGDMPYTNNTFGVAAQFFSFMHKQLLMPLTNRNLTTVEKAQLAAGTAALFGTGSVAVGALLENLFSDKDGPQNKAIREGLLDVFLNKALSLVTNEEQAIDFGDLAPSSADGFGSTFFGGVISGDIVELFAGSPAGTILFGGDSRTANFFKTASRYFVPGMDYEEENFETTFPNVVVSAANIFSGFSNGFKASYAWETGIKLNSRGGISAENMTKAEAALFGLFGFSTKEEAARWKFNEVMYPGEYNDEQFDSDVRKWYTSLKQHLAQKNMSIGEIQTVADIHSEAWRVFGKDRPKAANSVIRMINNDLRDKDVSFLRNFQRAVGVASPETVWQLINAMPSGSSRDLAIEIMESMENDNGG